MAPSPPQQPGEPVEPGEPGAGDEPRITRSMPPPLTPLRNPWVGPGGQTPQITNNDAASMGLDARTVEGAQVAFFSNLDGSKRSHRVVALVVLVVMFGLPLLLAVVNLLRGG